MSLRGRVAIVTGAAGRIGTAIVEDLCSRGMRVVVNDLDLHAANLLASRMVEAGFEAVANGGDIATHHGVASILEQADGAWLLVNNAGAFYASATVDLPEAEWDRAFNVDVKAAFLCSKAVLPGMLARMGGRIIVVSSIAGHIVRTGQIAYCAAKAAAIHFARCLAVEYASHGITVNCICPGVIKTHLSETLWKDEERLKLFLGRKSLGRIGDTEEIVGGAVYFASEASSFTTGAVLTIDGGMVI